MCNLPRDLHAEMDRFLESVLPSAEVDRLVRAWERGLWSVRVFIDTNGAWDGETITEEMRNFTISEQIKAIEQTEQMRKTNWAALRNWRQTE